MIEKLFFQLITYIMRNTTWFHTGKSSDQNVCPQLLARAGISPSFLGLSNFDQKSINRYRRGLETCPLAETSKSGHAIFFSFFRRIRATSMTQRRLENTRVHFWTFSPLPVNFPKKLMSQNTFLCKILFKKVKIANPTIKPVPVHL